MRRRQPWRPVQPNVSSVRCIWCGLRLHVILADRGLTEHVLCARGDLAAYDRRLGGPALQIARMASGHA